MSHDQSTPAAARKSIAAFQKLAAISVFLLTGCVAWTAVGVPAPNGANQLPLPSKLLIVTGRSDTTILRHPRIEGDAIIGNQSRSPIRQKSIPLVEIREMNKRTVRPFRTAAAILAAALVGGIIYEATRPPCRDCITLF